MSLEACGIFEGFPEDMTIYPMFIMKYAEFIIR